MNHQSTTLGQRMLEARMSMAGKATQKFMARAVSELIGKDPPYRIGSVSNWETGRDRPPHEVIRAWSKITGASVTWLINGDREPVRSNLWEARGSAGVPILTAEEAISDPRPLSLSIDVARFQTHWPCSEDAFAMDVFDTSNEPEFLCGTTRIVIEPNADQVPGDIVLAVISGAAVLGELREAHRQGFMVAPKNLAFREKFVDEEAGDRIVGVATEWATARRSSRVVTLKSDGAKRVT